MGAAIGCMDTAIGHTDAVMVSCIIHISCFPHFYSHIVLTHCNRSYGHCDRPSQHCNRFLGTVIGLIHVIPHVENVLVTF